MTGMRLVAAAVALGVWTDALVTAAREIVVKEMANNAPPAIRDAKCRDPTDRPPKRSPAAEDIVRAELTADVDPDRAELSSLEDEADAGPYIEAADHNPLGTRVRERGVGARVAN